MSGISETTRRVCCSLDRGGVTPVMVTQHHPHAGLVGRAGGRGLCSIPKSLELGGHRGPVAFGVI